MAKLVPAVVLVMLIGLFPVMVKVGVDMARKKGRR
jgi:hypothetical protein